MYGERISCPCGYRFETTRKGADASTPRHSAPLLQGFGLNSTLQRSRQFQIPGLTLVLRMPCRQNRQLERGFGRKPDGPRTGAHPKRSKIGEYCCKVGFQSSPGCLSSGRLRGNARRQNGPSVDDTTCNLMLELTL